jgi:hypothetical protein
MPPVRHRNSLPCFNPQRGGSSIAELRKRLRFVAVGSLKQGGSN